MSEQVTDEQKRPDQEPDPDSPSTPGGRKTSARKIILACLLVVVAAIAAYRFGLVNTAVRWTGSVTGIHKPDPAFTKTPAEDWISSTTVLEEVGKSPVDPARVLLPSLDKKSAGEEEDKAKSCPPELTGPIASEGEAAANKPSQQFGPTVVKRSAPPAAVASPENHDDEKGDPKLVETPVSIAQKPAGESDSEKAGKADAALVSQRPSPDVAAAANELPSGRKPVVGPRAVERSKKRIEASGPQRGPQKQPPAEKSDVKKEEPGKGEESPMLGAQLPGSLTVTIHNYKGDLVKWGLMVILDDSVSMGKKAKQWTPNRSQAAATFVSRLPEVLTPGSQLAVRDFLCNKSEPKKKPEPCPSHMLVPWTLSPFKTLKEKLDTIDTGGKNDPCAAAAYSLRKDFSSLAHLTPRILIVTGGATNCVPKDVIKALGEQKGRDTLAVDVLTLGIGKKARKGYAALVKKSNGLLLNMEKPADADKALERYGKILKDVHWEKVEVKGEKAVVSMKPGQEVILAPGTYTVTAPAVANLKLADRVVKNVKIESGKPRVLEIPVKKARPVGKHRKK